jgi:ubiquinone/menaquinone biosynthesis C-methylase UbiE
MATTNISIQSINELKNLYEKGVNISQYLRDKYDSENTSEIIEMAYDLQAGTYIEYMDNPEVKSFYRKRAKKLYSIIKTLVGKPYNIMEAGIGEGNFMGELLPLFRIDKPEAVGFDISWSRVACARDYLSKKGLYDVKLQTGNLPNIPFTDNAFDIVYTNHAVEPNRGKEADIIKELYRVTSKYLVMFEPIYELAGIEAQNRMENHGYVRNLKDTIMALGIKINEYKMLPKEFNLNKSNPSGIIILEKSSEKTKINWKYADPLSKTVLKKIKGAYFSEESLKVYPVIDGIPCLRIENGIVASKYKKYSNKQTKGTAHNRTVTASPPYGGSGYEKPQSG